MADAVKDEIVFVMAVGEKRFQRSVPEGRGEKTFRDILDGDSRWIEVDDSQWIIRDHVLYVYLSRSDSAPMMESV